MADAAVNKGPAVWESSKFIVTASGDGSLRFEHRDTFTMYLATDALLIPGLILDIVALGLAMKCGMPPALLFGSVGILFTLAGLVSLLFRKHTKKINRVHILTAEGRNQRWYKNSQGPFFPFDKTTLTTRHAKIHRLLPFEFTLTLEHPRGEITLLRTEDLKDFRKIILRLKDMGMKTPAWETYTKGVAFYELYMQAGGTTPAHLLKAEPLNEKDYE